ncbi:MAG: membrane protein [Rhodomicrobium sp.]|nr:MAG: membrane protein [Rhodomicrobium sp.]
MLFTLVATCTPGPNNIMLLASGMNYGIRRTIPHMLGIMVGFPSMVLLIGLGLAELFERQPLAYTILKVICTLYLLFLAWKIATAESSHITGREGHEAGKVSTPLTFLQAASFQWVNPKAWAMAISAISLYTQKDQPGTSIAIIALAFLLASIPSVNIWTLFGQTLRRWLNDENRRRRFNWAAAALLVASLIPMLSL